MAGGADQECPPGTSGELQDRTVRVLAVADGDPAIGQVGDFDAVAVGIAG